MTMRLGTHGWLRLIVAAALVLVLVLTLEASPAAGASRRVCRVRNAKTGQTYPTLQSAVDAATPGARLVVKGTCHGKTIIGKRLVIEGNRTARLGKPVLDGDGRDRVLIVWRGVRVTMSDLTLQDGRTARSGGGIVNRGALGLTRVVVRNNRSRRLGAGIWNTGTLRLTDSRVRENGGRYRLDGIFNDHGKVILNGTSAINANVGRGVLNSGTLTMNDASTIRNNWSGWVSHFQYGGGVHNNGVMTMNDTSSISGHRAVCGGGVFVGPDATLTMDDSSVISGNRAVFRLSVNRPRSVVPESARGGGVCVAGGRLVMNGSSAIRGNSSAWLGGGLIADPVQFPIGITCGTSGNVYGNSPDDCYFESPFRYVGLP